MGSARNGMNWRERTERSPTRCLFAKHKDVHSPWSPLIRVTKQIEQLSENKQILGRTNYSKNFSIVSSFRVCASFLCYCVSGFFFAFPSFSFPRSSKKHVKMCGRNFLLSISRGNKLQERSRDYEYDTYDAIRRCKCSVKYLAGLLLFASLENTSL